MKDGIDILRKTINRFEKKAELNNKLTEKERFKEYSDVNWKGGVLDNYKEI